MKDSNGKQHLIVQRYEPNNVSSIIHSDNLFKNRATQIYTTNVKDFFFKGDYLFTTKNNAKVSCLPACAVILKINIILSVC